MVQNAIKFNGEDSEVSKLAILLQKRVLDLLEGVKTGNVKKRKESEKVVVQPTKKLKLV
jgi:hypothetical protein